MQCVTTDAVSAVSSRGKSRKISFAFPVSIHISLTLGRVRWSKAAQCGQVKEAYSKMVIGASSLPSTRSFSSCTGTFCARAGTPIMRIKPRINNILCIYFSKLPHVDSKGMSRILQGLLLDVPEDGFPQALQRRAQIGVGDRGDAPVDPGTLLGVEGAGGMWRGVACRERGLYEAQMNDRAIAEKSI